MTTATTEKDELFSKAKDDFGVKLDRRLKLTELKEQIEKLQTQKDNPVPEQKIRVPKTVKNIFTGNEFAYTDAFEGLPDLEVIEWRDADGND